jgi:hypothetical protein
MEQGRCELVVERVMIVEGIGVERDDLRRDLVLVRSAVSPHSSGCSR